ncbi:hypothetical protein CPB83DRAFT_822192, partial [Crepidotus variabilis]
MSAQVTLTSQLQKTGQPEPNENNFTCEEHQLGIWKIFLASQSSTGLIQEITESLPLLIKLLSEIHASNLFLSHIFCHLWAPVQRVVEIYLSSFLLRQIEAAVISREVRSSGLLFALIARCLVVMVSSCMEAWISERTAIQESKIRTILNLQMMKRNLDMDLP